MVNCATVFVANASSSGAMQQGDVTATTSFSQSITGLRTTPSRHTESGDGDAQGGKMSKQISDDVVCTAASAAYAAVSFYVRKFKLTIRCDSIQHFKLPLQWASGGAITSAAKDFSALLS